MFIVQEIQTSNGITSILTPVQKPTREQAESEFYTVCGYAAISNVEEHTVMVYTHEGFVIPELCKCFKHPVQPEPVPEE